MSLDFPFSRSLFFLLLLAKFLSALEPELTVHIFWPAPHKTQCTGGVAALHWLHHALLCLGHNSYYHTLSVDCYGHLYRGNNNETFAPKSSADIIIVPEVFATPFLVSPYLFQMLPVWQKTGKRVKK